MIIVSKERWDSIYRDYKGVWQDYYNEKPEWIGRKVVMSGCICEEKGKLYVEGEHFVIEGSEFYNNYQNSLKKAPAFTKEDLEKAENLSYKNGEDEDSDIGFEYEGFWITNPFIDSSARFELKGLDAMYEYYGKENIDTFLAKILKKGD